jgi:3-methyladenine DNA glycosylase AlkD
MTKAETMRQLKAAGTAQNRKLYAQHGMTGPIFGVSYAILGKLKRSIKTDQALAEKLWATGNHDAKVLATMIADPSEMTATKLNGWARDLRDRGMSAALSNVAAVAPNGSRTTDKWTSSKSEWIGCAGWHTLASLARQENDLKDAYFVSHLNTIETKIHKSTNWVRYAMNNALISIGTRNPGLQKKATAAARKIGKVEVDHGMTGCKTPEAVSYIKKAVAHKKKMAAKAARGKR